jgi:hypothetical protein
MARPVKQQSKRATVRSNRSANKNIEGITPSKLRRYNLAAALLFLVQGILVLVLSDPLKGIQPIAANFLAEDKLASAAAGHQVLVSASHHLFDLNIAYLVAAFLFVSALAHLIIATWKRKVYEADLNKDVNRARWIEYSLSASLMMVAIALLVGVFDFASLLMIFSLSAIMGLLALAMELRNQKVSQVDWANFSIGIAAGVIPWLVIIKYIWSAHVYGSGIPGYVYWIFGSLLILAASAAVNMYLQHKKLGHWSSYLYGERAFIILSFVAITALTWQIFAGTLR